MQRALEKDQVSCLSIAKRHALVGRGCQTLPRFNAIADLKDART